MSIRNVTKSLTLKFVLFAVSLTLAEAEMVTLKIPAGGTSGVARFSTDSIILQAGDEVSLVYPSSTSGFEIEVSTGSETTAVPIFGPATTSWGGPFTIVGPATIRAKVSMGLTNKTELFTFSIKRANSTSTAIPSTAVVIPEDATGQYQVILESSTDLVTWAAANPGTYSGTTQKRFFRTRVVKVAP